MTAIDTLKHEVLLLKTEATPGTPMERVIRQFIKTIDAHIAVIDSALPDQPVLPDGNVCPLCGYFNHHAATVIDDPERIYCNNCGEMFDAPEADS